MRKKGVNVMLDCALAARLGSVHWRWPLGSSCVYSRTCPRCRMSAPPRGPGTSSSRFLTSGLLCCKAIVDFYHLIYPHLSTLQHRVCCKYGEVFVCCRTWLPDVSYGAVLTAEIWDVALDRHTISDSCYRLPHRTNVIAAEI